MRIAATADIHYGKHSKGKMQELFAAVSREADVLLICGDLTDYGLPEEAELLGADAAEEGTHLVSVAELRGAEVSQESIIHAMAEGSDK